jgi:hypothetical protein
MVDEAGQGAKDPAQETIFNSDIGDDWGEAFEAEDFMAAPKEEASSEFFLPDEPEESFTHIPVADEAKTPTAVPPPAARILPLLHSLTARFRQTPIAIRLAVILLPLVGLSLFLTLHRSPKHAATKTEPSPQTRAVSPAAEPPPEAKHPQPTTTDHEPAPPPTALGEPPPGEHKEPVAAPKLIRKKWRFPAIIVHAKTTADQTPIILTTDLTLILRLSPEAIPPSQRESFIREIIYQFFTNQPPDDLRRYALERGEMNRKLQAWLMKQWPDLPLDAIAIDRYQLL